MARKLAAVVFSLGCIHAGSVWSLGLGELSLESFLNEPLKAKVDLLNTGGLHGDEIKIRLATKEDFEKLGLDRAYFLTSIKFEVDVGEGGETYIVMSSEDPVLEPYLDFIIEARWPSGRLLREYTVLVDPPVFDQTSPVISASERVAEVEGLPAPAKKKDSDASSGTRVDVKKSDLAPGEMPQRDFSANTSATPAPGSRYMIRRDDTLWDVARRARPEGVSVHQTMLDIQRLNPDAFINGNINQIKAGYIVYLPAAGDISSEDMSAALAEVRQQNEDWREGRASEPVSGGGPSLRISAEPEPDAAAIEGDAAAADMTPDTGTAAAQQDADSAARERSELSQRLAAIQEQVDSLQRMVSLKDEQIAALQGELARVSEGESAQQQSVEAEATAPASQDTVSPESEPAGAESSAVAVAQPQVEATPKPKPTPKPTPKPAPAPAETGGGMMSYLLYGAAALLLAGLAFLFLRRRGERDEDEYLEEEDTEAAFADVELQDQQLAAEAPPEEEAEEPDELDDLPEAPPIAAGEDLQVDLDTRGYGERKHDEYASDVDEVDALAEADIYIAYGRYPQAIDLLKNAINAEPRNPAYRLKLLELYGDMGERDSALEQFAELKAIDEPGSMARAEKLLAAMGATPAGEVAAAPASTSSPLDLIPEGDGPLEADFSGLEIEDLNLEDGISEDLDLSADFTENELDQDPLEDELVIAAESNGLSTKLDLARAYLDMGDEDGARQILEEVAAEGTEELRTEALELLSRIG